MLTSSLKSRTGSAIWIWITGSQVYHLEKFRKDDKLNVIVYRDYAKKN